MASPVDIPLDRVFHVEVTTHDPTTGGISTADSAPTYDVFEEVTDTAILDDQTMTERTGQTGVYRGSFTVSTGNGFEVGKRYSVVATGTVNGVTSKFVVGTFWCTTAEATFGARKVDVSYFGGSAGTFAAGVPLVNVGQVGGAAQTARDLGATLGALNDAAADGDPTTTDTIVAYIKQLINTLVGTAGIPTFPAAAAPANAVSLAEVIRSIYTQLGVAGAGLTAQPWNSAWDAEVQSEVQDAIEANHLDHLLAATYDPASKPGAADALLNELVESDAGVARFTANALEQGPAGGGGGDATEAKQDTIIGLIGTPVTDLAADIAAIEAQTDDIGAAGAGLTGLPWNAAWDAEVQSEVADALAVYDPPTKAELDAAVAPLALEATVSGLENVALADIEALLDETIADSVPADGTAPSIRQGIYMLTQFMLERAVSGTTMTVKKPDGSTTLLTLTLNDANNPTSVTRS